MRTRKVSLTSLYPPCCELYLTSFISIFYRLYLCPFRFTYDHIKEEYKLEESKLRQVMLK